jgi:Bacterial PH domain
VSLFKPHLHLPGPLPAGETILWRGRPQWRGMAIHAFHVRGVAIYFGLFAIWHIASDLMAGASGLPIATTVLWLLAPCVAACGVLTLLAWLSSRTTQYTITSRRVIVQFGVALPVTLNIPFCVVGAAALRSRADGSGDIPLAISGDDRVAYLMLWPHVRPWRAARAEPMLRAIKDAEQVSQILARAVVTAANSGDGITTIIADKPNAQGPAMPANAVTVVA